MSNIYNLFQIDISTFQHKSKEDAEEMITDNDDANVHMINDGSHLTAEQMIQFLNNLAKHNSNFAVAREVKWGV